MSETFKRNCCAITIFVAVLTSAHAEVFEDTFRDFASCDASFFRTLYREAATWKSVATLESLGNTSWIKVKNRHEDRDNHIDFTVRPTVAGLRLLSYFDRTSDLDSMGLYYYWGFMVAGKVEGVAMKLKPLIHSGEQLRHVGAAYVRTEIEASDSRWLPFSTTSNNPASVRKGERVFVIEQHEDRKDVVRVSCSLQGRVTADVLKELRPDIDSKDYPKQDSTALFDDIDIPESVAKIARHSTWTPRFKKLSYTFNAKRSDSPRESPVTVEVEAQGGLVRVREIYSSFNVQRLMLAGLVQLKARMNGVGDDRVLLTTNLKLTLPAVINKGEKLSAVEVTRSQPPKTGDKEMQVLRQCDVLDEIGAENVFRSLTGRAFRLVCTSGEDSEVTTKVFLEDLGIAITLDSKSKFGNWTYQLTQFSIER
jgi:hypothetical protein